VCAGRQELAVNKEQAQAEKAPLDVEKAQAKAEKAQAETDAQILTERLLATLKCVVCMEAKSNVLLEPCMHMCCCTNCSKLLGQSPK